MGNGLHRAHWSAARRRGVSAPHTSFDNGATMHSLSLRRRLAALLLLPLLLLVAGCARVTADFDITSADSYDLDFDMAVEKSYVESEFSSADELCKGLEDEDSGEFGQATWKPYTEDDMWGCKISGTVEKKDFGSGFAIDESDGELHLKISPDSSFDPSSSGFTASDLDLTVTFSFPGKVIESNVGTVDGKTVTITDAGDMSKGVDITAKAGGIGAGLIILIVAVVVVLLIVLIIIALIVFFVVRSRRRNNAQNSAGPGGFGGPAGGFGNGGDFGGTSGNGGYPGGSGYPGGGQGPSQGQNPQQGGQGEQWNQAPGQQGQQGQPGPSAPSAPQAPSEQQPWNQPPAPQGQQGEQNQQGQQPWGQQPGQGPDGEQPWSRPPQS
ncbi:hypothetical protein I8D64_10765 [Brachybacterium sp. MASK1Z-5]|uniref:LppM domain-containing protein n=1 Tax=Brachybacterium halotolerans TaxID=2795215 RepID=A0ABS1BBA9_9MICO|nr:hypothetical protein [Brachybacterium halotolerans]MBK0331883.1 hypothetical protein [Brachybacterium halotolerans]